MCILMHCLSFASLTICSILLIFNQFAPSQKLLAMALCSFLVKMYFRLLERKKGGQERRRNGKEGGQLSFTFKSITLCMFNLPIRISRKGQGATAFILHPASLDITGRKYDDNVSKEYPAVPKLLKIDLERDYFILVISVTSEPGE